MVFLLLLIYLSAVTCISEERNLRPCWRKDILRVKGQALIKEIVTFFMWVGTINMNLSAYWVATTWCADKYPCLFLLLLLYLITVACILEISFEQNEVAIRTAAVRIRIFFSLFAPRQSKLVKHTSNALNA